MAEEPVANYAYGEPEQALTFADQGFVLLVASTFFFTTNRADRAFVRSLAFEALPAVNRAHPYLAPIVALVEAMGHPDTRGAQQAEINTELSKRIHDFLRWRGLMAMAKAQEAGQVEGPKE